MVRARPEIVVIILFITLCVARSFEVWAADMASEDPVYELEEIVVTATRVETPREEVAANITGAPRLHWRPAFFQYHP